MDQQDLRTRQAGSFGAAAAEYARARPSYPIEAVDWLLPRHASRVLDLAAGTGLFTRRLVDRGLDVVAVEPSDGMRAELTAALPGIEALAGLAESIPLPNASVDAVTVAQAWHWVDVERAVPEVARVLRPGGTFGLVWNVRDETVDWVARLGRAMHPGTEHDMFSNDPPVGPPFAPIERRDFRWTHTIDRATLLDLVASRSYFIVLPPDDRAAMLGAVTELLDTHPDLSGRDEVAVPYITRCSRTTVQ
ncbi:MAG: hypothetical protein QOF57_1370 [Frankiaceae bacterium]|nr:hypothetical protein [Frankiaceae bacterium]